MVQGRLYGAVLLLGAGLLAVRGRVHGRQDGGHVVIATSQPVPTPAPPVAPVAPAPQAIRPVAPVADDGRLTTLRPVSAPGTARPPAPAAAPAGQPADQPSQDTPPSWPPWLQGAPGGAAPAPPGEGTGPSTAVAVAVVVRGPETVSAGAAVVFQIEVANRGTAPLQGVVVRDQLPPGLRHPAGDQIEGELGYLAAGQVRTIPLEVRAARAGRFTNRVTVLVEGKVQAEAQTVVTAVEPVLVVRLQGPRQSLADRDLDFQLDVSNPGGLPAAGLRLALSVPEGLEFVAASTGGAFRPAEHALVWPPGALAEGQSQGVTFRLRARTPGDWAVQAVATAERLAGATATHAIHVEGVPALALEVPAHDAALAVGGETTYELRVLNKGSAPGENVRLVAWLPEGLAAVQVEGPAPGAAQGQQVVFLPLAQLPPRVDAVYRIRVRGRAPAAGRFRVELRADSLPRPVREELSTLVRDPREPHGEP